MSIMSIISNRKVDMNETQDNVKQPAHYTYGDIEIIDFIEQVKAMSHKEVSNVIENYKTSIRNEELYYECMSFGLPNC